jgi:hypothetical protein
LKKIESDRLTKVFATLAGKQELKNYFNKSKSIYDFYKDVVQFYLEHYKKQLSAIQDGVEIDESMLNTLGIKTLNSPDYLFNERYKIWVIKGLQESAGMSKSATVSISVKWRKQFPLPRNYPLFGLPLKKEGNVDFYNKNVILATSDLLLFEILVELVKKNLKLMKNETRLDKLDDYLNREIKYKLENWNISISTREFHNMQLLFSTNDLRRFLIQKYPGKTEINYKRDIRDTSIIQSFRKRQPEIISLILRFEEDVFQRNPQLLSMAKRDSIGFIDFSEILQHADFNDGSKEFQMLKAIRNGFIHSEWLKPECHDEEKIRKAVELMETYFAKI